MFSRCSTPERAGYYLDAALTSRSTNMAADLTSRDSHFIFSLHVYQYSVENNKKGGGCGVIGGRSRLHLIDFGCCDRTKTSGGNITLSGLGNVILGIFNGQRHLPFKVKNFIITDYWKYYTFTLRGLFKLHLIYFVVKWDLPFKTIFNDHLKS